MEMKETVTFVVFSLFLLLVPPSTIHYSAQEKESKVVRNIFYSCLLYKSYRYLSKSLHF